MTALQRRLLGSAVALALVAAAVWAARSTEWVEVDVPTPAKGKALRDRLYAAKRLAIRLGARVSDPQSFEHLPPPTATLVLGSPRWNMFPGREEALQRWVEGGGRLVVFIDPWHDDDEFDWLPIRSARVQNGSASAAAASAAAPPALRAAIARSTRDPCLLATEPQGAAPAFGAARSFRVCGSSVRRLTSETAAEWQLDTSDGAVMMRVPIGKGSVVANAIDGSFANDGLLLGDGALVFAAALQLHAGDEVWFVDDESRTKLLALIWEHGAPALLVAAAALALALWRGGSRFGPQLDDAVPPRRSMAEQIKRTADFIARGDGAALHRAALRALEETARRTVPDYASAVQLDQRSAAIGRRTGGDAAALATAMKSLPVASRARLAATIALLEQTRRSLLAPPKPARTTT